MARTRLVIEPTRNADGMLTGWLLRDSASVAEGVVYFSTKGEAIEMATRVCRARARRGERLELTIKKMNGRIQDRRTYPRSSDPLHRKG